MTLRRRRYLAEFKIGTECRSWTGNRFNRERICRNGVLTSFYSGGETPYNFKNTYGDGTNETGGPFANSGDSEKAATKAYQAWFKRVGSSIKGGRW